MSEYRMHNGWMLYSQELGYVEEMREGVKRRNGEDIMWSDGEEIIIKEEDVT